MDDKTARDLDRILAEGDLSGPEADAILERVLADVRRDDRRRRPRVVRYWPAAAGAVLAAAAAMFLVVRGGLTGTPGVGPRQLEEGTLGAKIEIRCANGTLAACPVSSSLVFTVSDVKERAVLTAYAQRVGTGPDPKQVLYFEQEGGFVEIPAATEGAPASEHAQRLSPGHKPGRYRVHAFVAGPVRGREEMRRQRDRDARMSELRTELVIVE